MFRTIVYAAAPLNFTHIAADSITSSLVAPAEMAFFAEIAGVPIL